MFRQSLDKKALYSIHLETLAHTVVFVLMVSWLLFHNEAEAELSALKTQRL